MTLDCDRYRINIPNIKSLAEDKTEDQRIEMIGKLAIITGVPIIIVCHYIGELYGFTDKLQALIKRLKEFYTVDEVINIKA